MTRLARWLLALLAPLLLASCIVTPGKFASTLDIRADRSFTFTYVGEVVLMKSKTPPNFTDDGNEGDDQSWQGQDQPDSEPSFYQIAASPKAKKGMPVPTAPRAAKPEEDFGDSDEEVTKLKALAEALSREYGYRSVRYIGNRRLMVHYRISGRLDHSFLFPFNPDGNVVLPFLAVELRGRDRVRVKAPGFANEEGLSAALGGASGRLGGLGGKADASALDGTFTLTSNAAVVSQNQEDGVQTLPNGDKSLSWRATPQTRDAPMAVLRLDPLP